MAYSEELKTPNPFKFGFNIIDLNIEDEHKKVMSDIKAAVSETDFHKRVRIMNRAKSRCDHIFYKLKNFGE